MGKYIWMCVEANEYELPLAVADTAKELGEMVGSNKHNVITAFLKNCSGRISGTKYVRVLNEGADDE